MPHFRKLSQSESATLEQSVFTTSALVAREYDAYIADFAIGDYGRVELASATQRYQSMLPRWMRDAEQTGRQERGKRRA